MADVNVGTIEAVLEFVDNLTPTASQMIGALDSLAQAMGTTREAILDGQLTMDQMAAAGQLIDESLTKAGISVEEFANFLQLQREGLADSSAAFAQTYDEAVRYGEGLSRAAGYMEELRADAEQMREVDVAKAQSEAVQEYTVYLHRTEEAMRALHDEAVRMYNLEMNRDQVEAMRQFADEINRAHEEAIKMDASMGGASVSVEKVIRAFTSGNIMDVVKAFGELPAKLTVIVGVLTALAGAAFKAWNEITKVGEQGERLERMSLTLDIGVETLQRWGRSAELAGGSINSLQMITMRLQRAVEGNGKALKSMGLDKTKLDAMSTEQQVATLAKKLTGMEDAGRRNAAMMTLLGRSGAQLFPVLKSIADGAGSLAAVLSKEDTQALAAFNDAWETLGQTMSAMKEQFFAQIATSPALRAAIQGINDAIVYLIPYIRQLVTILPEIGIAILAITGGPIGLIIAGVYALIAALIGSTNPLEVVGALFKGIGAVLGWLSDAIKFVTLGFVDFKTLFQNIGMVVTAVKLAFQGIMLVLTGVLISFVRIGEGILWMTEKFLRFQASITPIKAVRDSLEAMANKAYEGRVSLEGLEQKLNTNATAQLDAAKATFYGTDAQKKAREEEEKRNQELEKSKKLLADYLAGADAGKSASERLAAGLSAIGPSAATVQQKLQDIVTAWKALGEGATTQNLANVKKAFEELRSAVGLTETQAKDYQRVSQEMYSRIDEEAAKIMNGQVPALNASTDALKVAAEQYTGLATTQALSTDQAERMDQVIGALSQRGVDAAKALTEATLARLKAEQALSDQLVKSAQAGVILAEVGGGAIDKLTVDALAMADAMAQGGYGATVIYEALVKAGVGADLAKAKVDSLGPALLETGQKAAEGAQASQAGWEAGAISLAKSGVGAEQIRAKFEKVGATSGQVSTIMATIAPYLKEAGIRANETATHSERLSQKLQSAAEGAMMLANVLGGGLFADLAQGLQASIASFTQFSAKSKDLDQQLKEGKISVDKYKDAKFENSLNAGANAAGLLGGMLAKSTNATMQQAGAALQGAAAGAKMGASFGPIGAGIGAAIGGIMGWISAGKKMKAEVTKMYDEFVKAGGGLEALGAKAKEAGVSLEEVMKNKGTKNVAAMKKAIEEAKEKLAAFDDLLQSVGAKDLPELKTKAMAAGVSLQAIWDAKTVEEYKKAVDDVKKKMDLWNEANEKLNAAMEKYGITLDQLGPKMRQQKLDEQAMTLFQDWQLLIGAGVDMNVLIEKMGPNMNEYVNQAVKAGATIPEAMKPAIDALYQNGKLLHENGQAYTQAEYEALKYGKSQQEMFDSLIAKITDLVNALLGIPTEINTNVNTNYTHTGDSGGGGGGGEGGGGGHNPDHEYASGSGGFINFGQGANAVLHGVERVQTQTQFQGEQAMLAAAIDASLARHLGDLKQHNAKAFRDAVRKRGA